MHTSFLGLVLLAFFCSTTFLQAQTDDNIIWASLKVQKKIDDKTSVSIAPTFRINENISAYQNMSVDAALRRKLGKGWFVQILERTWFIPEAKSNRQFLWFDVAFQKNWEQVRAASSLRLHYAFDLAGRKDADFIRWKTTFGLSNLGKIKPFISIEPWFRLNEGGQFQRMRYEPGFNFQFNKQWSLLLMYRREFSLNLEPSVKVNMFVVTLAYSIPSKQSN